MEVLSASLLIIALSAGALWLVLGVFGSGSRGGRLPPGPRGLPLVGSLLSLDPQAPHLSLTALAQRYDPGGAGAFSIRLGTVRCVVLTDATLVRRAFELDACAGRAPLYLTHGIMGGKGIICAEGELWREQRRFVAGCLRSLGMVRVGGRRERLERIIAGGANALVARLHQFVALGPLDPAPLLLHHVGNVVSGVVFGRVWEENDITWTWLLETQEKGTKLIGVAGPINFLPWLRFLPHYRRMIAYLKGGQHESHLLYRRLAKPIRIALQHDSDEEDEEFYRMKNPKYEQFVLGKSVDKIEVQTDDMAEVKTEEKADVKTEENTEVKSEDKTEVKSEDKTEVKSEDKTEVKSEVKSEDKTDVKSEDKTDVKSEDKTDVKSDGKTEDNSEDNTEQEHGAETEAESKAQNHVLGAFVAEQMRRRRGAKGSRSDREAALGHFDDDQRHHLVADLFGAGLDTTIVSLRWFLLLMATHPEEQERVAEELRAVLGARPPTLDDAPALPRLHAALAEAQRIRPVVPVGIPHGVTQEVRLGEWTLPKGTMLLPLLWAVHMNETHFPEPQRYCPDRFLAEDGRFGRPPTFMPFQAGKRMCVGETMANMMLVLFGGTILHAFKVSPAPGDPYPDLEGVCGITLAPKEHRLLFEPRA